MEPQDLLEHLRRNGVEVHDVARPPDSDVLIVFLEANLNQGARAYALLDAHPGVAAVHLSPTTAAVLHVTPPARG